MLAFSVMFNQKVSLLTEMPRLLQTQLWLKAEIFHKHSLKGQLSVMRNGSDTCDTYRKNLSLSTLSLLYDPFQTQARHKGWGWGEEVKNKSFERAEAFI